MLYEETECRRRQELKGRGQEAKLMIYQKFLHIKNTLLFPPASCPLPPASKPPRKDNGKSQNRIGSTSNYLKL
ncbi:hypothetical protein NSTCB13_02098 [Nostoc sp. DSM 114160]|jgi:hypothetical protein